MPLSIPVEIWLKIAEYMPANPFDYLRLSQVSRSSRAVFLSDRLWRDLDFDGSITDISHDFVERMSNSDPLVQAIVREGWKWIGQSCLHTGFSALKICIEDSPNSPGQQIVLSFNNVQLNYSHPHVDFAHLRLVVFLTYLDNISDSRGFWRPLNLEELAVFGASNTADPMFMALFYSISIGEAMQ